MKRVWHAYGGFMLCLLTAGLVWIYLDIRVASGTHFRSIFIHEQVSERCNTSEETNTHVPPNDVQFYNVINSKNVISNNTVNNKSNVTNKNDASRPEQSTESASATESVAATESANVVVPQSATSTVPYVSLSPGNTTGQLSAVHIVVIVSYMRSGSTFTADILQHFPGTVYVFEPFHMLMARIKQKKPMIYLNGTKRLLTNDDLTDDFLMDELRKWFTCRYDELDVYSLADNFHSYFSRSMKKLIDCWSPKRHTLKSMRECVPDAVKLCEHARHRLFKFIRLPMRLMHRAMELYPNLQVIHLMRDPRGSLTSQIKVNKVNWDESNETSTKRCSAIADDLNYTFPLISNYPKRVGILIYETLASKPLQVARKLLTFLNYPPFDYVMRYIKKLTSEGRRNSHSFGIIRGNSTKTAFLWRQKMNFSEVEIVDNNCQHVYNVLGFRPMLSSSELVDDTIPTHVAPELQGML